MSSESRSAVLTGLLPMFASVAVLLFLGISSIYDWSLVVQRSLGVPHDEGKKQLIFLLLGIVALLVAQMVHYRTLLRLSHLLFVLSLLPVLYTVIGKRVPVPFVHKINGAYNWINFGPFSFQPSEVVKITLVMLLAWMYRDGEENTQSPLAMIKGLAVFAVAAVLILQQDLGTLLTMIPPVLAILFLGGVRVRHLAALFGTAVVLLPLAWFSGHCKEMDHCTLCPNVPLLNHLPQLVKHYQRGRVQAFLSQDPKVLQGKGFQQQQALEAIGSGGLEGKGRSIIPVGQHVPFAHTDMILSLVAEQYGLGGSAIVLLCYLLLLASTVAVAAAQRDFAGKLLVVGLGVMLAGQAVLNISVVMRLMPVTGVPLPFMSYGGTSLASSFLALGLIVNVARNQKKLLL
jgi:rod shape determining protein RodA